MIQSTFIAKMAPLARFHGADESVNKVRSLEIPLRLRRYLPPEFAVLSRLSSDLALELIDGARTMQDDAKDIREFFEELKDVPGVPQERLTRMAAKAQRLQQKARNIFRVLGLAVRRQDRNESKSSTAVKTAVH